MEYMSCPEAAKKWEISERRVQKLCEENRIPGVSKIGYMWLIDYFTPRDPGLSKAQTRIPWREIIRDINRVTNKFSKQPQRNRGI